MPFPNVTSHRRMPHLPNTPKTSTTQLPPQDQQQQADHGQTLLPGRELENSSSHLRLTAGSSTSQKLLQDSLTAQQQPDSNAGLLTSSSSASTLSGGRIKDTDMTGPIDQDRLSHTQQHYGGLSSPLGPLSLPTSTTSPSLTTQDSKLIKSALYDAFGVLYHPSAHTKHSLSTTAAALRSGDVTPLMGLSPKASPLLRPNVGTSAPITPLELSEEATASGYFGLHIPPASASSVVITGTASNSAAGPSTITPIWAMISATTGFQSRRIHLQLWNNRPRGQEA
ncbi:hypothetical protein BGX33_003174 [Mortierella sp. NVP41]|nr:hypothetical protein BGX33_003174 [Mortierella sp. NVP41]